MTKRQAKVIALDLAGHLLIADMDTAMVYEPEKVTAEVLKIAKRLIGRSEKMRSGRL